MKSHIALFTSVVAIMLVLSGCRKPPALFSVVPVLNAQHLHCENRQYQFKYSNTDWQLLAFHFFLTDFKVNGQPIKVKTSETDFGQLVLLGGDCSRVEHWQVYLEKSLNRGDSLSFTLGVPFAVNHLNPLKAQYPLNQPHMFWNWQLGYKFLRLDMLSRANKWSFHLGSIGCQSNSALRPPAEPCIYPNQHSFTIQSWRPDRPVFFDLSQLFRDLDIINQQDCMGDPSQQRCKTLLLNLRNRDVFNQMINL